MSDPPPFPSERNTESILWGRKYSLFGLMNSVLFNRLYPFVAMRRDGTQELRGAQPHFESRDLTDKMLDLKIACEHLGEQMPKDGGMAFALNTALEAFGCRWAMYWFAKLLDSPYSLHISRCDRCKSYFAYETAQLRSVKYGVFCPNCESTGNVMRMKESRSKRFDTAARAWLEWNTRKHIEQRLWVADQVNKVHGTSFGRRWVSQHLTEIQERVEALCNAKRQD